MSEPTEPGGDAERGAVEEKIDAPLTDMKREVSRTSEDQADQDGDAEEPPD